MNHNNEMFHNKKHRRWYLRFSPDPFSSSIYQKYELPADEGGIFLLRRKIYKLFSR